MKLLAPFQEASDLNRFDNCGASDLPPLKPDAMAAVRRIYDDKIRPLVHHRW